MNVTTVVRIKRGETAIRARAAAVALSQAGYRPRTVRRDGHPVRIWVRS